MDIESGEVFIPTADMDLPALRAMPKAAGPHPVIVVIHEIFGLKGHLDKLCEQWARDGYYVIAPLFYFRQGDVHQQSDHAGVKDLSMRVPDVQVRDDLDRVFAWLKMQPQADAGRVGITGFCWGGREVWLYAAHNPAVKAGVAWYGGPITAEPTSLRPINPLDVAAKLKAPVLGLYGGSDHLISMESIGQMQRKLAELGSPSQIHVYPAARHGFHAHNRKNHDPDASKDGELRLMEWFARHGVR